MELKTYLRDEIDWELPFPPEEYAERRQKVRAAMSEAGVDLLLLCRLPDINWLTGYDMIWNHLRNSTTLVVRADSDDTLFFDAAAHTTIVSLVPEIRDAVIFDHDPMAGADDFDIIADELAGRGLTGGTIGLQFWGWGPAPSVVEALAGKLRDKGARVVEASLLVETLRIYKSPREVEVMRQASAAADNALEAARRAMEPGVTETGIEAVLVASLMEQGCNYPAIHTMVASGVRSGTHHSPPTLRKVRDGDLVHIDVCGALHRYHVNTCRTFSVGKADDRWLDVMERAAGSIDAIIANVKPGDPLTRVDEIANGYIRRGRPARLRVVDRRLSPRYLVPARLDRRPLGALERGGLRPDGRPAHGRARTGVQLREPVRYLGRVAGRHGLQLHRDVPRHRQRPGTALAPAPHDPVQHGLNRPAKRRSMRGPFVEGERLFSFALIADSHVTEEEAAAIGGYDVDTVMLSVSRSRYVVDRINRLAPDFAVHLGDITHPEPGTPAYEDSARRFHRVYEDLDCPLHLVAGNHDIGEKAFPGEPLTAQQARRTVNDDMIAEYERHFSSHYHAFEHEDCLFVAMNGMIVNSGLDCEDRQRRWLEGLLAGNAGRRIFVFSHYPPYLSHAGESGHYDATDEPGRSWLLGLLERHRVEAHFAGHVHNFFFNRHGPTNCYVLPSTCFLRHDYHELFRAAPGMKQGRHDGAKLGYAVVDVHERGHLTHIVRTFGRTLDEGEAPGPPPVALPAVHGLKPAGRGVGLHLRQPWCESADIPTPWGLDVFRRKRVRNDYPLLALWEMGVNELRVPLDDLCDPATRARMAELAALGHRFTACSYGLPGTAARQALADHGHHLASWEVIAPVTGLPDLLAGMEALKGGVPVLFNALRPRGETFSCSHGLQTDERGAVKAVLALDGADRILDGMVFGIGRQESPATGVEAARAAVEGLGIRPVVHVQFARRGPAELDGTGSPRREPHRRGGRRRHVLRRCRGGARQLHRHRPRLLLQRRAGRPALQPPCRRRHRAQPPCRAAIRLPHEDGKRRTHCQDRRARGLGDRPPAARSRPRPARSAGTRQGPLARPPHGPCRIRPAVGTDPGHGVNSDCSPMADRQSVGSLPRRI